MPCDHDKGKTPATTRRLQKEVRGKDAISARAVQRSGGSGPWGAGASGRAGFPGEVPPVLRPASVSSYSVCPRPLWEMDLANKPTFISASSDNGWIQSSPQRSPERCRPRASAVTPCGLCGDPGISPAPREWKTQPANPENRAFLG